MIDKDDVLDVPKKKKTTTKKKKVAKKKEGPRSFQYVGGLRRATKIYMGDLVFIKNGNPVEVDDELASTLANCSDYKEV